MEEKINQEQETEIFVSESEDHQFRQQIVEYYLPKQLIDAIFELGEIPRHSVVSSIGVGFLDIADYTYLSKFLSPNENQALLDGLFTALHWVLKQHGGYLNKIEGDSMMFHYGGLTDPIMKGLNEEESRKHIAAQLFYSCIEMQRVCSLFNRADVKFIYEEVDAETKGTLQKAFDIISSLRNNLEIADSINALFQIRVRIGASIGEVTVGNIGPKGAKQWDIIGLPVITAKRMESTSPVGGLRISEELYRILKETGVADAYYNQFKREALALFSVFKDITWDELFMYSSVLFKDKKGARFDTYSVQVNPGLPESLARQMELFLDKGESGADKIIEFLQYYRGNRFVINAMETFFRKRAINLRLEKLFRILNPKRYEVYRKKLGGGEKKINDYLNRHYSLYSLFEILGNLQDSIKYNIQLEESSFKYVSFDNYMAQERLSIQGRYKHLDKSVRQNTYFFNVLFPLFFRSIRTSILEYQNVLLGGRTRRQEIKAG